jgi:hypothetical protein
MTTATLPASQIATDKQVAFVKRLLAEKNLAMIAELALAIEDSLDGVLTKQAASAAIDALMACPRKPQTSLAHDDGNAVGEGYYFLNDEVYKVVAAKGSGNLYAKKFGRAGYEYAPGAMRSLAGAARLTLEQAAAMGRATGICVICGRLLTAAESVTAGIGPICAGRL